MTTVEKVLNIYNFSMSGGEKNLWISMIKNKQATLDQFKAVIEEKIEEEKSNKSKPNNPVIQTTRDSPSTKPTRVKKPCNCGKGKNKDWSSWDK